MLNEYLEMLLLISVCTASSKPAHVTVIMRKGEFKLGGGAILMAARIRPGIVARRTVPTPGRNCVAGLDFLPFTTDEVEIRTVIPETEL